jgi:hypothetical protein
MKKKKIAKALRGALYVILGIVGLLLFCCLFVIAAAVVARLGYSDQMQGITAFVTMLLQIGLFIFALEMWSDQLFSW